MNEVSRAADRLMTAERMGTPCLPVRDLIGVGNTQAAYEVQQIITNHRIDAGAQVVGHKIGLTSRVVQTQLGVNEPDYGALFADMVYSDCEPIPLDRFIQPKIEAEVAFILGRDLESPTLSITDVIAATDYVLPAFEIVDSRIQNWDITIVDTVADNASSGALVLGTVPRPLSGLELPAMGMVVEHSGQPVSTGIGSACLGSPIIAVAWLARTLARRGTPLCAGEVILSGALGAMVPVTSPGAYRARLDGLGDVTAIFTEGVSA
ncbi:fumarylacetoacetate hydrolase family protein [Klugiella xanthotipulae]|uniref:2-keto-4-pentenoate hydratase n=1 Tax=Klugiella xanthotipulae TaxID=244735 RepID=A0A543HT69_9MICO|nr:fumarylacetoacetate hydrolase family protein [Klugiella xanthotipulae]TQM61502.1 2-keto-4-pentenoate hydratase [Klugiella xanthotipulae]